VSQCLGLFSDTASSRIDLRFNGHTGSGQTTTSWLGLNPSPADGNWHRLTVSVDGTTRAITLYVDGVAQGTNTYTSAQAVNSCSGGDEVSMVGATPYYLFPPALPGYNEIFSGSIKHVVLVDSSLSASEVQALGTCTVV